MSEINDGGQAFPISDASGPLQYGLTIRDWFAGKALTALIHSHKPDYDSIDDLELHYARRSYDYADAMIKARDTSGG